MLKSIIFFLLLNLPSARLYSQEAITEYFLRNYAIPDFDQNNLLLNDINLSNHFNSFTILPKTSITHSAVIDSIITLSTSGSKGKITINYTDSGKIASFTIFYLQDNLWFNGQKITNTYDSLGNILLSLNELWNGSNWVNYSSNYYTYDYYCHNILNILKAWNGNSWEDILRISKTYNSNGDLNISITEKWGDSTWINSSKLTWYYHPNKLKSSVLYEVFLNNYWQNNIFTIFNYDDNWNLVSILNEQWDGRMFNNYVQTTFSYSSDKQQTNGLIEVWDNSKWINNSRYFYSYNSENYFKHGLYEYWENNEWIAGDGNIQISNPDGFELHFLANEIFIYYNKTTSMEDGEKIYLKDYVLLQSYPNPFNPSTTIKFQIPRNGFVTLNVYDILGNEVATLVNEEKAIGKYEINFDASRLASGVYLYRLDVNDYVGVKKMILLR